jgi:hypothetical protein
MPPAPPAEAPPPEERTRVLGVPLPDLAQTGRNLKQGVQAIGDAVLNLPKAF